MGKYEKVISELEEQEIIQKENRILTFLLPIVGLLLFIFGLLGFILAISQNVTVGIILLFFALIGGGGIAYGIVKFVLYRKNRFKKEESEPSLVPNPAPDKK